MTERRGLLAIDPLFMDIMGGEFTPPSDKLGRRHTLGRLMVAGYDKGESSEPTNADRVSIGGGGLHVVRYVTSWAQQVEASTFYRQDGRLESFHFIAGLGLVNKATDVSLTVAFDENEQEVRVLDGTERTFGVELGPELNDHRRHLADHAQAFFDTVTS